MFDAIVVGGGPAGITAAIYLKRAGKSVVIIERSVPGGQITTVGCVENYPAFEKISGSDLSLRFFNHAESLGIEFIYDEAISYKLRGKVKKVICKNGEYKSKSIILALGSMPRELNVEGERAFFGKGISYCATCDGNFFKGKDVAVIGSGDSAVSNALYLSNICNSVSIFAKGELKLKAYKEEVLKPKTNVFVLKNVKVNEVFGDKKVAGLKYIENGEERTKKIDGIFVAIGRSPDTDNLKQQLKLDEKGYIIAKDEVKTGVRGVFACGDVTTVKVKQIVVAASSGALAATECLKFLDV